MSRAPLPSLVEPRPLTKPLGRAKLLGLLLPEVLVAKREAVARRPSSAVRRLPTTTMRRECAADVRRRSAAKVPRELGLSPKHHRRTKPNLVPLDVDPPEGAARHLHETYPRHRLSSSMSMSHLLDTRKASSKSRAQERPACPSAACAWPRRTCSCSPRAPSRKARPRSPRPSLDRRCAASGSTPVAAGICYARRVNARPTRGGIGLRTDDIARIIDGTDWATHRYGCGEIRAFAALSAFLDIPSIHEGTYRPNQRPHRS